METLSVGCKAYFDCFTGLIPAVVVSLDDIDGSHPVAKLKLTASRGAYKRGETIETSPLHAIPRKAVFVRARQYRIRRYLIAGWGFATHERDTQLSKWKQF